MAFINLRFSGVRPNNGFDSRLASSIWSIHVYGSPMDSGNLRRSIKQVGSSSVRMTFIYDGTQAYYLKYLQEGIGFVKKHKGFIDNNVVNTVRELIYWSHYERTTYTSIPSVQLNKARAMGYERKMLQNSGLSNRIISSGDRARLSKIYNRRAKENDNEQFTSKKAFEPITTGEKKKYTFRIKDIV